MILISRPPYRYAYAWREAVTSWLLDTNVLSELRCPKPNRKVLTFIGAQPLDCLFISILTLAEIRFGIELRPEVSLRAALIDWLTHKIPPMCDQRVPPVSQDIILPASIDSARP